MSIFVIIFTVLIATSCAAQSGPQCNEEENVSTLKQSNPESRLLNDMLINYDKQLRPLQGGPPVEVNVSMHIRRISAVSETQMEYTVEMYFREHWYDPRLNYSRDQIDLEKLHLTTDFGRRIWTPDLFFTNEVNAYSFSTQFASTFLKLYPGGYLVRSTRYSNTLSCPMDLKYYPMDTQTCPLYIESYAYEARDLRLAWLEGKNGVSLSSSLIPNFEVKGFEPFVEVIKLSKASYARLAVNIQLSRAIGYYLIQIYVPAALLVVVSWFSLWMNQKYVAERISLGVTTVLTITTLLSSTNATSPKIPYVKAVDVYMGICFGFVFAALFQSVAVARLSSRGMSKFERRSQGSGEFSNDGGNAEDQQKVFQRDEHRKRPQGPPTFPAFGGRGGGGRKGSEFVRRVLAQRNQFMFAEWDWAEYVDRGARVTFPLTFIIINIMYWVYYLHFAK